MKERRRLSDSLDAADLESLVWRLSMTSAGLSPAGTPLIALGPPISTALESGGLQAFYGQEVLAEPIDGKHGELFGSGDGASLRTAKRVELVDLLLNGRERLHRQAPLGAQ